MIADWSELVVEVSQRIKDASIMQRAAMLTGLAEAELNKALRTAEMEMQVTMTTDANGVAPLPYDFLDVRTATVNGKRLLRYPLAQLRTHDQRGYAVAGNGMGNSLVSTEKNAEILFDYYAQIPSLKENGTNWLLQSDPEIYLYALTKQAMLATMNLEGAAAAGSYLSDLLERKRIEDAQRRFGDTQWQFAGTVV